MEREYRCLPRSIENNSTGVRSEEFVERRKEELGTRRKDREVTEMERQSELREPRGSYKGHFKPEKSDKSV